MSYDVSVELNDCRAFVFSYKLHPYILEGKMPSMSGTMPRHSTRHRIAHGGHFAMKTKVCYRCKKRKLVIKFGPDKKYKDKLHGVCRLCVMEMIHNLREKNPIKYRQDALERYRNNPDEKNRAHRAISNGVRDGHIIPATICGYADGSCSGGIEAHHWHGYDEEHKYDVIWLCKRHHALEHVKERHIRQSHRD